MDIVVQKFGGTSVATPEARRMCVSHVKRELKNGNSVVVVVSAMGRKGDPYATDTLLSMLEFEIGKREKDMLLNTGELISATVFSSMLEKEGINTSVLSGGQAGIITNDSFGSALILDVMPKRVQDELRLGKVVVIPGFQGVTINGDLTTLGRGGSDTSAAAIGAGLGAKVIDIFTDVEGLMTADPRIVKEAKYLEQISYQDVAQMAWGGASVIHPRAVELAMKHEIPMRIRSTFSDKEGTTVAKKSLSKQEYDTKEVMISGVVSNGNIHRFSMCKSKNPQIKSFQGVFSYLEQTGISIDFINITSDCIYFTVSEADSEVLCRYLSGENIEYIKEEKVSKISIVGNAINGVPGIMTKIIMALEEQSIEVLQTSDSNTTIWILVNSEKESKAICSIHKAFFK